MRGLKKAAAETKHLGYDRGLETVIYYSPSEDMVYAKTVQEGTKFFIDGCFFCGECRFRKSVGEIRRMVEISMKMVEDDTDYAPRLLPDDVTDEYLIERHRAAFEVWPHGELSESWVDDLGYICIRYSDGTWYHYGRCTIDDSIVWW